MAFASRDRITGRSQYHHGLAGATGHHPSRLQYHFTGIVRVKSVQWPSGCSDHRASSTYQHLPAGPGTLCGSGVAFVWPWSQEQQQEAHPASLGSCSHQQHSLQASTRCHRPSFYQHEGLAVPVRAEPV